MTVRGLLSQIDSREISEWIAYDQIEPIGSIQTQLVGGIVASTIANCHRGKNQSAFAPMDFMPLQKDASARDDSVDQTAAKLEAFSLMGRGIRKVEEGE